MRCEEPQEHGGVATSEFFSEVDRRTIGDRKNVDVWEDLFGRRSGTLFISSTVFSSTVTTVAVRLVVGCLAVIVATVIGCAVVRLGGISRFSRDVGTGRW